MFSKNIRIVYLYLISIVALGMIIGGTIATISNIADLAFPVIYSGSSLSDEKIRITRNIIYSIIVLLIGLPLFVFNWRGIEKERTVKEEK